jgi:type I restriction-modification system DNA methylase subunit
MPRTSKTLQVGQASHLLSVSEATLRNWVKLGLIETESKRPLLFKLQHIEDIRAKIANGEIQKLNTRANKLHSSLESSNISHLADQKLKSVATKVIELHRLDGISYVETLAACALVLLALNGKVTFKTSKSTIDLSKDIDWTSKHLSSEFERWRGLLQSNELPIPSGLWELLESMPDGDLLGVIYQGIIREGDKSKLGSYYTPTNVIELALESTNIKQGKFLDPCCGTGQFLIQAIRKFSLEPSAVHGIDLDPIAVQITRFNLLQEFEFKDIELNVICGDTILEIATETTHSETDNYLGQFDVIATNPPWGAIGAAKKSLPLQYKTVSGEMFALVIEKSLKMLKANGHLSLILPESVLKIAVHKDIREILLKETRIQHIVEIGRPFPGVMSSVILLSADKGAPDNNDLEILLEGASASFKVKQKKFLHNKDFLIELNATPFDDEILKYIYSQENEFLGARSEWALGVVTGNNKAILSEAFEEGMVPVYKGSDVESFAFSKPKNYFYYRPESFQQVPSIEIFNKPQKLVYRFISSKLIFALDSEQRITLNSANLLIPNLNSMPMDVAVGFLNSKVFQYIYEKKFSTTKVLKNNLMQLPFPVLDAPVLKQIATEIASVTGKRDRSSAVLDQLIFKSFKLSDEYIAHIEKELEK